VAIALGGGPGSAPVESKPDGTFEFPVVAEGEWRFSAQVQNGSVKLRATEWIDVGKHDVENVKLRLVPPVAIRGRLVVQAPKDAPAPPPEPLILSLRGGRTSREEDIGPGGAALVEPEANGEFVVQDAYPGAYYLGPMLPQPRRPFYLDAIRIGDADLTMREVEISFDVSMTVVYKTDGGSVHGKAEDCASGGVVLVPADPARRRPVFSRSGACDSTGNYEIDAVRPGDYYALAFAGNGPVPMWDDVILNQAVKVSVRAGEASSADPRTVTKPIYWSLAMRKFLRYITNNEAQSRHEEVFDGIFWIVETIALIFGIWILLARHNAEWIPFLIIEYCWAMDNLRHNRPWWL
jgi:hypothetical protein